MGNRAKMSRWTRSETMNQNDPEAAAPRNQGAGVHADSISGPITTKKKTQKWFCARASASFSRSSRWKGHEAYLHRVDLQRRAIGYAAAVSEAGRTGNTHGSRSTRGASSSASSAGGTPGPVLGENGANLGPPTMTGVAPLEAQRPTLMRPHATDTLGTAPDSPFDDTLGKGTRLIDLEAFLTSATGTHSNKHRFKVFTSKRVHKDCLSPTAGFAVNQGIALAAAASRKLAGLAAYGQLCIQGADFSTRRTCRRPRHRDGCSVVVHGGPRAGGPIDRGGHQNQELQYQDTAPRLRLNAPYWHVPPIEALFWSLA